MHRTAGLIKYHLVLVILFLSALGIRLLLQSHWLEDWDSVQFALALHDFSIVKHQPHPPGYPLYIVLGRILNLFLQNDTFALTSLSAVLGTASAIPLFLISKNIADKRTVILATVIFLVTPIEWNLSEVALSNIPGMFFTITTALFIYLGRKKLNFLLTGSFLAGITLGVRFAEWSIVLSLLLFVLIYRREFSSLVKSSGLFAAGILIWLIPLLIDTGWNNFISAYSSQTSYILTHDSFLSINILDRLLKVWGLFLTGYSIYFVPILALVAFHLIKNHRNIKQFNYFFVFVWFFSYLIPLTFIYNLEVPRHVLPLLPPTVILLTLVLHDIKYKKVAYILTVTITLFIFYKGFTLAKQQYTLIPPTIAPVIYVKNHFDSLNTTLITTFTYRQFQYYAPEFNNYYDIKNAPAKINSKIVIIDYQGMMKKIPDFSNYEIFETKEFNGPQEIFPRLPSLNLYILKSKI